MKEMIVKCKRLPNAQQSNNVTRTIWKMRIKPIEHARKHREIGKALAFHFTKRYDGFTHFLFLLNKFRVSYSETYCTRCWVFFGWLAQKDPTTMTNEKRSNDIRREERETERERKQNFVLSPNRSQGEKSKGQLYKILNSLILISIRFCVKGIWFNHPISISAVFFQLRWGDCYMYHSFLRNGNTI